MTTRNRFSSELRDRAVRMVEEHRGRLSFGVRAINAIAWNIGCTRGTLRRWVREEASRRAGSVRPAAGE